MSRMGDVTVPVVGSRIALEALHSDAVPHGLWPVAPRPQGMYTEYATQCNKRIATTQHAAYGCGVIGPAKTAAIQNLVDMCNELETSSTDTNGAWKDTDTVYRRVDARADRFFEGNETKKKQRCVHQLAILSV